ncbi:hypothetical protein CVT25_000370 [Psilocybe cyanescens]|uniref:UDP-glycosyltransferases domain-containing protein n=1 Tax=Psilocybe cyanescens TaxID=93625 RepID=A0A409XEV0_PSICY|nr:hypothetical protein CVT25_000370 [Psilocybe cyanescens]
MTHIFFSTFPAWGHVRAFCILAARLVKENKSLTMTLLLPSNHLNKAQAEVSAEFGDENSEENRRRIRVFCPFKSDSDDPLVLIQSMIESYPTTYQLLLDAKPVTCAVTGSVFEAVSPPKIVILDFFAHPQLLATRAITGKTIPVAVFVCAHAAAMLRILGPEHYGGRGDLGAKVEAEAARRGITPQEVGDSGSMRYRGLRDSDAVISASAHDFEPESLEAFKSWFKEWNKEVYTVGPLIPSRPTTFLIPSNNGQGSIEQFLDRALADYGPKSAVLISFGSLFWPNNQEYLEEVIEALIEKKFPFIVSYASPYAKISDDLLQRVNEAGSGLIAKWLPQLFVLSHPVRS